MNEEANAAAANEPAAPVADNINSEQGSVTPDEVAQVLNIKAPVAEKAEEEAQDDDGSSEEDDKQDTIAIGDTEADAAADTKPTDTKSEEVTETPEAPSFALEVEDANGNKITINPEDDIEEALKDFEPKSNGQIFKIIADFMEKKQEAKAYAETQAAEAAEAEQDQKIADIQSGWDAEAKKLVGEKRLPVVAEGKENERLNEVYRYMFEQNQARVKAGQPPIQTLEDALDKLELKEKKEAEAEAAKKAKEDNRARGGLVGGSSAPASNSSPTYAPRSATNATQALKNAGLL
jgi:hypothetical protein